MITTQLLDELIKLLPKKITTAPDELKKHGGNLFYISHAPDVVCYPESDEDVVKVVNFCLKNQIPLIPYGSGTSVEGHTAAVRGGICLDMSKMDKVLEFNPDDGYVVVQPGIPYNKLNEFLEPHGFHFPVEAGWGASIGGMTATNASGAGATDAGSMTKNVLSCSVVVHKDGAAAKIKTGTKSPKSSAGYNLTSLFVGSEGTLGVFTDVTLKVRKNFDSCNTIVCQFDDLQEVVRFVIAMKGRVQFRRVELMDKLQTDACMDYSGIDTLCKNKNTLIIELSGNKSTVQEETGLIKEALAKTKAVNLQLFPDRKSAEKIWMMRKNACNAAIKHLDPTKKAIATDVSVPLSKLADCINACYQHMSKFGINAPLVAHVGDGNFHFTVLVDPNNEKELQAANAFNKLIVLEALKVGGTCTGEHGVGLGKMPYLRDEHGDSLSVMKTIKEAMDPAGIFNPGKIVDIKKLTYHCTSSWHSPAIPDSKVMLRAKI